MRRILIVDDERALRTAMRALLIAEGFAVSLAKDGTEALGKFRDEGADLVLLDVLMPKMNGFRTCEEIRKIDKRVPVVFLTAKDSEADQVRGIGLGADDYISKGAGGEVLMARVRRALTRVEAIEESLSTKMLPRRIDLGRVAINFEDSTVESVDGTVVRLTKTEGDFLRILAVNHGKVVPEEDIIMALRGAGFACGDNLLYSHASNLRKKLGVAASLLVRDHGRGYRLIM